MMLPTQLSDLISICSAAPCGKALQTVVDEGVRRTLETERVKVDWAALPEVLNRVAHALTPNATLQAHFHKVLVYRPGDFFKYHHDSKRAVEHLLTLTVDLGAGKCEGGDTVFRQGALTRSDGDLDTDEGQPMTWKPSGDGGDWCCWFTSQPHRVAEVTKGYRVVAMFDVFAHFPEGLPIPMARRVWNLVSLGDAGSLPLVGQMAELLQWSLCPADAVNAACTCRRLKGLLSSTSMLLCQWLRQEGIAKLLDKVCPLCDGLDEASETQEVEFDRLGLVLQNRYSFDGQSLINPWHLRGRDRFAYEAFELLGAGLPEVSSCKVVHETVINDSPRECLESGLHGCRTVRFRVAREVTCSDTDCDEALELGMLSPDDMLCPDDVLNHTYMELDDDLKHEFWPFRGVIWACDHNYMDTHFLQFGANSEQVADDGDDEVCEEASSGSSGSNFEGPLWGNQSTFALFWYKNAVLLSPVLRKGACSTLRWASDIYE
eukprot:gnl/MRDRNA2_/MRDRNA2_36732_c0_seq1.p1 gnl/MRDRNA2_/MRDRNA2_36732_c0~~gnl/MRDRNA2_/MRDRNA2_36732_c0_seq1.p1  ORF type:complete len:489 (-),score=76.28 gnl/MRDRNA2_/MRDRNA2_36732_c0_seq1:254-1720(-)